MARKSSSKSDSSTANLGFEADFGKEHAETFRLQPNFQELI